MFSEMFDDMFADILIGLPSSYTDIITTHFEQPNNTAFQEIIADILQKFEECDFVLFAPAEKYGLELSKITTRNFKSSLLAGFHSNLESIPHFIELFTYCKAYAYLFFHMAIDAFYCKNLDQIE